MDLRLKAFESPEFDRVFGAVASLAGAADEERLDVPEIEAEADEALNAIAAQAQEPKSRSRPSACCSIKGATGTGKTHTLLTAIRRMHQEGGVYAALFPMVDLVAEKDLDAWLLRALDFAAVRALSRGGEARRPRLPSLRVTVTCAGPARSRRSIRAGGFRKKAATYATSICAP